MKGIDQGKTKEQMAKYNILWFYADDPNQPDQTKIITIKMRLSNFKKIQVLYGL